MRCSVAVGQRIHCSPAPKSSLKVSRQKTELTAPMAALSRLRTERSCSWARRELGKARRDSSRNRMRGLLALLIFFGPSPAPVEIEHVAWLQGCWEIVSPQRTVEEQWM